MTESYENYSAVVGNLCKARKRWEHLSRTLGRQGGNKKVSRMFIKAMVQVVLCFGAETWVMNPCTGRALGGFQHRVVQRINGRNTLQLLNRIWEYPPLETDMKEVGFEYLEAYVIMRKNTVMQ